MYYNIIFLMKYAQLSHYIIIYITLGCVMTGLRINPFNPFKTYTVVVAVVQLLHYVWPLSYCFYFIV